MAAQATLIDECALIYNTSSIPSLPRSAVFLSMTIDPPAQRRRSVHKFTSEDLAPALKNLAITPVTPKIQPSLEIQAQVRARIPTTTGGECFLYLYHNNRDNKEHLAIVFGDDIRSRSLDAPRPLETETDRIVRGAYLGRLRANAPLPPNSPSILANAIATELKCKSEPPLARIHSECLTGETLHSFRCDCGEQLDTALDMMQREMRGVLVYMRQEGRGIGLLEKLKAYNLQDLGHDTLTANLLLHHPADARTYDIAAAILKDLGLNKVRLLTNNPEKIEKATENGIEVIERVGMVPRRWESDNLEGEMEVDKYLKAKVERMRHILNVPRSLEEKLI